MRNVITATIVIMAGLAQLTFPAVLAPFHVVPDVVLLVVLAMALYYRPTHWVLWWAGLAGLMVDLWQPSHFGGWTAACLVVAGVAVVVHTRVLPRLTQPGALITSLLALSAGVLVLAFSNAIDTPLGAAGASVVRLYIPKLIVDMALAVPLLWIVRKVAVALRLQPAGPHSVGSSGGGTNVVIKV